MKQRHFSGLGNTVDLNSFYTDQSIFCTGRYRCCTGQFIYRPFSLFSDCSVCL